VLSISRLMTCATSDTLWTTLLTTVLQQCDFNIKVVSEISGDY